jgi:hypothetical protein
MEKPMKALLLIIGIAFGLMAVAPDPAEARKKSRGYTSDYSGQQYRGYRSRSPNYYRAPRYYSQESTDCLDARYLDPGGNYRDFPCWAQKAFAPKRLR